MSTCETTQRQRAMLCVIDVQTRLLPHIAGADEVVAVTCALVEAAGVFELPIVATVQYTAGLGRMDRRIAEVLERSGAEPIEKAAFSVCRDEDCRDRIDDLSRDQVIVAGIEAHVCVQQTVIDLLNMGLQPMVCADAVSSRRTRDRDVALERMRAAGAVVTTAEAVMFELCEVSGTPDFKAMLAIVKRLDEARTSAAREATGVV